MTDQPRTVEPALRDVSGLPPVVRPRLDLPIRTPRLVLRPLTPADYAAVAAYRRRPDVARYLGGPAWTDLSGPGAFEAMLARDALEGPARCATLGVERDGELVGHVVLRLRDAAHDALGSIGWVFSPWVAGLGYATESGAALIDAAFAAGLHRLDAHVEPRNVPSVRLCERLGMTREAHLRRNWWTDGRWADSLVYGLLAEEWPQRRAALPGREQSAEHTR